MSDEFAVRFASEYLAKQFADGKTADLVGMLNHVDFFERVVMVVDEVNETLRQNPSVYVQRIACRIVFTHLEGEREITEEDLNLNAQMYHEWFVAQQKRQESGSGYIPPEAAD